MSKEQVIKLNIVRLKLAVKNLAQSMQVLPGKWQKLECYFKVEDLESVTIDDIILKDSDKMCRRSKPRLEVKKR